MKLRFLAIILLVFAGRLTAAAQVSINELVKEWERSKTYTQAYLDAMPDGKYELKPTQEMRSFAAQFLHLADANYALFAAGADLKSPVALGSLEKSTDQSKANVTKIVMESYDFVISNLRKMSEQQMRENVRVFNKFEMTRAIAMVKTLEHQAHHRGQTTVYLRMGGVKPPEEQLF
ncbi:damage-inducible protein DinB [Pedobacter yulinensis]|uniref:Damage-inducible protein DinB n=1 Tax=Pedobacter yulinensis TaxID=2126353 RepID=A0A2T3HM04_9SPHI|nr:DinB family protein [Pedobacter yulinensis]PST83411.1 damage-inducible protein DinB [Pedobacter yulinensis]